MCSAPNEQSVACYYIQRLQAPRMEGVGEMHGARRVVIFCLLTAVLPTILLIIPLYLRHSLFADVVYSVAESDVLEIGDGISTVFCQDHTLKMNASFNAYQLETEPEISTTRKHIRLKKSMSLPDDTLEYWGFFLPKESHMVLSVCSRLDGARILVVKGDKNLQTCGLLDHSKNKAANSFARVSPDQGQVRVIFETVAQEIHSNETIMISSRLKEEDKILPYRKSRSLKLNSNDLDFNDAREVESGEGMKAFRFFREVAKNYINKYHPRTHTLDLRTFEETIVGHKLRHSRRRERNTEKESFALSNENIEERLKIDKEARKKRNTVVKPPHNLDVAKVAHGGNAINFTEDESSASSFETSLLNCYDGKILLNHLVPSSDFCVNTSFLHTNGAKRMTTTHNVNSDGYYYYIFYSDNDDVQNDIHAIFDIFKPTYEYANFSKNCMNKTECTFPLSFLSNLRVVVEVPTRDGIEHDEDDLTLLLSICQPRMEYPSTEQEALQFLGFVFSQIFYCYFDCVTDFGLVVLQRNSEKYWNYLMNF